MEVLGRETTSKKGKKDAKSDTWGDRDVEGVTWKDGVLSTDAEMRGSHATRERNKGKHRQQQRLLGEKEISDIWRERESGGKFGAETGTENNE